MLKSWGLKVQPKLFHLFFGRGLPLKGCKGGTPKLSKINCLTILYRKIGFRHYKIILCFMTNYVNSNNLVFMLFHRIHQIERNLFKAWFNDIQLEDLKIKINVEQQSLLQSVLNRGQYFLGKFYRTQEDFKEWNIISIDI